MTKRKKDAISALAITVGCVLFAMFVLWAFIAIMENGKPWIAIGFFLSASAVFTLAIETDWRKKR